MVNCIRTKLFSRQNFLY